jgi:hypothetical protein
MPRQRTLPALKYTIGVLCALGCIYVINTFSALFGQWFLIVMLVPVILLIILPPFVHHRLGQVVGHVMNYMSSIWPYRSRQSGKSQHEDEQSYERGYQSVSSHTTPQADESLQAHLPEVPQACYPELPQPHDPLQQPPM